MTYTIGTWRYSDCQSAIVVIQGNKLKAVADFGKCDLPETRDNAQLMSASKEMYAALNAVMDWVNHGPIDDADHFPGHLQSAVLNAKLKAEG